MNDRESTELAIMATLAYGSRKMRYYDPLGKGKLTDEKRNKLRKKRKKKKRTHRK